MLFYICVCSCVCNCMEKTLYLYETPMYFRYIYYFVVILLWGVSLEELHMYSNLVKIFKGLRGFSKMGFSFILVGSNIWIVIV